ncbi:o-methyltransferase family 3 [Candidatus Gastranaerophilus sp. (ex Termes propinquus)]|nr:o-methyltransferase family 3 [Candidatus Gastranaerophilus sp. (ex Termes propinquus)]
MRHFDKATIETLVELEKTRTEFWNLDRASANFLNMLIKISNAKNVLELGTSNGYSGVWLAKALEETGGRLTTVEFWDKRLDVAAENFKTCKVSSLIETRLGSASHILKDLSSSGRVFDFVLIDANKLEYLDYFNLIHPMLISGGIIASDNISSHAEKVKPFLDVILNHPEYQNEMFPSEAGLLISRKLKK